MRYLISMLIRHFITESRRTNPVIEPIVNSVIEPFSFNVTLERYTIEHRCAVDSGMEIIASEGDYDTFSDMGDTFLYAEYLTYCKANSKAINKEQNDRYRY